MILRTKGRAFESLQARLQTQVPQANRWAIVLPDDHNDPWLRVSWQSGVASLAALRALQLTAAALAVSLMLTYHPRLLGSTGAANRKRR